MGACPANLLPRFVLGVRVLTPGWGRALIQPHPGTLVSVEGGVPTPRGEISVAWKKREELYYDPGSAARRDGKGRAARVPGFARSLDRRRKSAGASRRAVVEIGKRCFGNTQDRGAMTKSARIGRAGAIMRSHLSIGVLELPPLLPTACKFVCSGGVRVLHPTLRPINRHQPSLRCARPTPSRLCPPNSQSRFGRPAGV